MNPSTAATYQQIDKSVSESLEQILNTVKPSELSETLPLFSAFNKVLAQAIISPINVPPHNNSAMDGYAFNGESLDAEALKTPDGIRLKIIGETFAGHPFTPSEPLTTLVGVCIKITTGAVMPEGFDTVIPKENCSFNEATQSIVINDTKIKTGDNRRLCGEDLQKDVPALQKGQKLTPAALGLIASLGIAEVCVMRPLKVAYFSTGDEILSLGDLPRHGAVYDSNRYTVFGMLSQLACEVIDLGCIPDQPELLKAAYISALSQADCIITSGGVSVGEADFTKTMMAELAQNNLAQTPLCGVEFWRIAMRPGRPMAFGLLPQYTSNFDVELDPSSQAQPHSHSHSNSPRMIPVFGLPGNPVAVMVTFMIFVKAALQKMQGAISNSPRLISAISSSAIRKKPGRTEYQRAFISLENQQNYVKLIGNQGSGVLSSMTTANCLVVLAPEQGNVQEGDWVQVMLLD